MAVYLTVKDIKELTKTYLIALFTLLGVFGLPYILFVTGAFFVESTTSPETYSGLGKILTGVFCIWFVYMILRDPSWTIEWFRRLINNLDVQLKKRRSRLTQTFYMLFLLAFVVSGIKFPIFSFWTFVLFVGPIAFTYDEYMKLIERKHQ